MSRTWCTPGFQPTRPALAAQSEIVHIVIGWGFNQWHLMVVTLIGMVLVASCDQSPFKKASCWAFLWVLPDVNNHRNCQDHGKEDGLKCQKFKYDLYKFLHVVVSTDVEMFMTLQVEGGRVTARESGLDPETEQLTEMIQGSSWRCQFGHFVNKIDIQQSYGSVIWGYQPIRGALNKAWPQQTGKRSNSRQQPSHFPLKLLNSLDTMQSVCSCWDL